MLRPALSSLLALILLTPTYTSAQSTWASIVDKLEKSTVQLAANCSGFIINTEKHYVMTAKHCGPEDIAKPILVDNVPSKVVAVDVHNDFMVLEVPELDRPALPMADKDPQIGEQVASYGYGYGLTRPMLRISYVSQNRAQVPEAGPGEWILVDTAFVGGQSGSAVVNAKGEVVMIVQMATNTVGLGRGIEQIKDRVGKYWQKAAK